MSFLPLFGHATPMDFGGHAVKACEKLPKLSSHTKTIFEQ